jgi:penicillin G amidase
MNKYVKTFLGSLIVIVPALLAIGWLFNNLSGKSFYPTSGQIAVSGLKQQVRVYFDDYGVPQVLAQNEEDAFFTQGYLHAQDRLFQMDLSRRVAEGRLSEIFGRDVMDFDKLFRTIGIGRFCYNWYANISPKSKAVLESYTEGVNKFIDTYYKNLPVEFDALNYRPEPWKPEHSLMLGRLMAWDLNIAWYTDYIIGEMVNKVGLEKTSEVFPDTNITIFKKPPPVVEDTASSEETGAIQYLKDVSSLGKNFFTTNENYRKFFNINASHTGSNSWVISSDKSAYGKPILANDPHLALQAPSRWYEVYLKGGNVDVRGMSFPGIPGIVIGNNRYISWGLTNLMNDDNDFIILNRDSTDNTKYIYNNQLHSIDSIKEKIYIKDSVEVEFIIRTTKIGPVISDLSIRGFADYTPATNDLLKNKLMTFKWTGYEQSDEVLCFYNINTSKSWENFKDALKDFCTPAQNFLYADIYGNIGYHAAGKIPIRKTSDNNSYIFPMAEPIEWTGFVEFDKMPNVYNPKEGYIITANTNPFEWLKETKITPETKNSGNTKNSKDSSLKPDLKEVRGPLENYYISYLWEPASRFNRIKEFISSKTIFDFDDFRLIQNSYESPYAREISKYISGAYKDKNISEPNIKWCIERFNIWNGDMLSDESISSVYNTFLVYLIKNIYEDELGKNVFDDFLTIQNIPYRSLELILKQNDNVWFDNVNTKPKETRDDILQLSLEQAVEYLKTRFTNPDINTWHWGELHKVKIRHPLGMIEALDKTFNIGPWGIGGDQTSPNNTEYHFKDVIKDGNYNVVVGASMRMIINMADVEHPFTINSTGQSGQPVHSNYKDQTRMWMFAEYKNNTMSELEMLDKKYNLLILTP